MYRTRVGWHDGRVPPDQPASRTGRRAGHRPSAASLDVLVVAAQLSAPVPGGTGRYAAGVLRSLEATRPEGAQVAALLCGAVPEGAGLEVPEGVRVRRAPVGFRALARLWERGLPPHAPEADLVHAPTLMVPPVRDGTPLVVTIHDSVPWTHPETLTPRGVSFHRRMGERVAASAAGLLAPTSTVAAALTGLLSPAHPVRVVPPAVVPVQVPDDAAARRASYDVPSDEQGYLLFVGTAEPRKGLDVLVEALALDPGLPPLVVAGPTGWGDVRVDELARAGGVGDRVRVVGRVPDADLAALYDGARALAVPSRAEGFGLPVVEAMSVGVPVVTSDDPALLEVGDGLAGVAPVGDAGALAERLAEAVADGGGHRAQAAADARRGHAARYAPSAVGQRLWAEYARVLGRA